LLKALNTLKPTNKLNKKQLRFSIQDIYELNKEKVIVGKMLSGRIKEKQLVKLLPSAISKRIKLIKTFGRIKKVANAGENIGLVLNEYTLASRGGILVQKDCLLQAKTSFRGNVFWISKNPLELNMPFIYRCANQEVQCVAKKIEKIVSPSTLEIIEKNLSQLKYNHVGTILFETEKPIVIEPFNLTEELGRFIIEEANIPVGVGIIV